jgi:hypothetical protein
MIAILIVIAGQAVNSELGIAAQYPGDKGIAQDPAVLFADDFENGIDRWDEKKGAPIIVTSERHGGKASVEMPMIRGKDTGCHLLEWFGRDRPGPGYGPGARETVYARFYVKFPKDYSYAHHFVWLLANPPENRWQAFGKAGKKPDGSYFSTAMEPWFAWGKNPPPGEIGMYSYYLDMEIDPKMNMYWGNGFFPSGPGKGSPAAGAKVLAQLDRWQCWEFMIKANSAPEKADGEQAMWLDGKLVGRFPGLRWRTRMDVKIDAFWLEHYGMDPGDPTKQYWKDRQSVFFDDVVVASKYIGPRHSGSSTSCGRHKMLYSASGWLTRRTASD